MKTTEQVVAELISIGAANQPAYIYQELRKRGYGNQYQPSASILEAELWKIYVNDKPDFWNIMRGLQFDATKTNSSTQGSTLRDLAIDQGMPTNSAAKFNIGEAWGWIVGTIGGKSETVTAPTVVTESKISIGAVIGLIVVAGLLVTILYFAFFKKS